MCYCEIEMTPRVMPSQMCLFSCPSCSHYQNLQTPNFSFSPLKQLSSEEGVRMLIDFNGVSFPPVDTALSCSATFSSLLHKYMNIYYHGGKHTTVHNDCSWKNDNKHERLTGLRRVSSPGTANQGLWNVKTTVIPRTTGILETCRRTLC